MFDPGDNGPCRRGVGTGRRGWPGSRRRVQTQKTAIRVNTAHPIQMVLLTVPLRTG